MSHKSNYMRLTFMLLALLFLQDGYSQNNGEWFARKGIGFTVFTFSGNYLITEDKRDSIDAVSTRQKDTNEIVQRIKRNAHDYLILKRTEYGFPIFSVLKLDMIDKNCFLNCISLNKQNPVFPDTSLEIILGKIEADTFPEISIICYSRDSLIKAKSMKPIRTATISEFILVLDDMIKYGGEFKKWINKELNGNTASIFWYLPLVKGDFETKMLLKNQFSPIFSRSDYDFLLAKYGKKRKVKKRLKKLEGK